MRVLGRRRRAGYEVRREVVTLPDDGDEVTISSAYTLAGDYIGSPAVARRLIVDLGIRPERIRGHRVCSVGYCPQRHRWYGWSHRAIAGFRSRRQAVKFARSVS